MPVYWSMLIVTTCIGIISQYRRNPSTILEGRKINRIYAGFAIIAVSYIIFFVGFRDRVADSGTYINTFNNIPSQWNEMIKYVFENDLDIGFYLPTGIFKIVFSESHYAWFFVIAIISCTCLFRVVYKYSEDFPLSIYFFVASCMFTWLINGMRQFVAVCILFAFTDWLIEGKKIKYILLALAVSTIHSSAIFAIPICLFISSKKILDKKMMLFGVITVIGINFAGPIFSLLGTALDMDYADSLSSGGGSNVIRLVVNCIPLILVLLSKKYMDREAPPSIKLAANMSFISACFSLASTFTNGILIGRMPIYFSVYELYLFPWIFRHCFEKKSRAIMTGLFIIGYLLYFIYQMEIAWGGLIYTSDFLNLEFLPGT